jgi:hypothetical protein
MILTGVDDPGRFSVGEMKRFAYVHTNSTSEHQGWRVYRAILLNEFERTDPGSKSHCMAHLLYVDDQGGIRIEAGRAFRESIERSLLGPSE